MTPNGWKAIRLAEVAAIRHGFAFAGQHFRDEPARDILLTPGNVKIGGGFKRDKLKYYVGPVETEYVLRPGDLVVTMTDLSKAGDTLGYSALLPAIVGHRFLHNQRIGRVEVVGEDAAPHYVSCLMSSDGYRKHVLDTASGTTVRHTSPARILDAVVLLPPLGEQRKIAAILSSVDDAMEATQAVIEQLQVVKKAMMAELLTRGLPGRHTRFKLTEIGEIPEEWEVVKVGAIGRVIRGASPRPKGDQRYYGGSVPRLMVADVTRDGKCVTPRIDFLTEAGAALSRPVPAGTLTIVCSGTVGVPALLAVDACIHDGFLAVLDLGANTRAEFLYYSLSAVQHRFYNAATHGGIFTNLTTEILREFPIVLPDVQEQERIAAVLDVHDNRINIETDNLAGLRAVKSALMSVLLTGEVRVKPDEEAA